MRITPEIEVKKILQSIFSHYVTNEKFQFGYNNSDLEMTKCSLKRIALHYSIYVEAKNSKRINENDLKLINSFCINYKPEIIGILNYLENYLSNNELNKNEVKDVLHEISIFRAERTFTLITEIQSQRFTVINEILEIIKSIINNHYPEYWESSVSLSIFK